MSSIVRVWCGGNDGARDSEPVLEESEKVCKSDKLGIVCRGGTNTIDAEPEPEPEPAAETLLVLAMERIVLIEPVGEPGSERLGSVTVRSNACLERPSKRVCKGKMMTYQMTVTQRTLSLALSAASRSTPSLYRSWKGHSNSIKGGQSPSAI